MSEEISQLKERITTLQKNKDDLESSIRDLNASKSKLVKELAEFEIFHKQTESDLTDIQSKLKVSLGELENANKQYEKITSETQQYIKNENEQRKKREVDAHILLDSLQSKERELRKTLNELQTRIDSLSTAESHVRNSLKTTENELKIVNGDLVESNKLMSEYVVGIEDLRSSQQSEQTKLDNILRQIDEKTPLLNEIDSQLNKVTEERQKLEAEKAEFSSVVASVNRQKEKVYQESLVLEKKFKQLGIPVKLT